MWEPQTFPSAAMFGCDEGLVAADLPLEDVDVGGEFCKSSVCTSVMVGPAVGSCGSFPASCPASCAMQGELPLVPECFLETLTRPCMTPRRMQGSERGCPSMLA